MSYAAKPLEDRFWPKVAVGAENDCWEWQAHRLRDGYGWLGTSVGSRGAHRVSALLHGLISGLDDPTCVLHKCDNPPCCNPAHLFTGTVTDNNKDKGRKKRGRTLKRPGEANPACKLTEQQVQTIRAYFKTGKISQGALAIVYGVQQSQISRIISRVRRGVS